MTTTAPAQPTAPAAAPARTTPALISRTAVGLVLALALVKGLSPFAEPDLWWHLRVGDRLRDGAGLVAWDPSAGFAERPYTANQWLPEVVASAAYSVGGTGAVLWLRAVVIVALIAVVYAASRRYAGRLPSAVAAGLTLVAAGGGLNPRPQLVGFVLFAVTVHAWNGMARDRRPRWWLVAVFWLWACCHGLWIVGIAFLALMVLTIALDPQTRPARPELRRLGLLWVACLAAVAVTPLGPGLLLTPFQVAGNAVTIADEWRPTPLNNVFAWAALVELLVIVVAWALMPRRRPWWQFALLGFAAFCTLWMWRLVPLGAIAAAPLVAAALQGGITARRERWHRGERRALLAGCAALLALGAVVSATGAGSSAAAYPTSMGAVDDALGRLPARTVVLDDFGISGWLLWAHPELTPVADLRGEIYPADHLTAYRHTLEVRPGWQQFVTDTRPGAAVLAGDSALADALVQRLGWRLVARTPDFVLLTPGGS